MEKYKMEFRSSNPGSGGLDFGRLYANFNARHIESVLEHLAADVNWPNGMSGGRVFGRAAVRAYWISQWELIDPWVEPLSVVHRSDGKYAVQVHQIVKDKSGVLLVDQQVTHVYEIFSGLIVSMNIE
jgi:hypothetical protein